MCPNPGITLRITATASLALPSAVSVAPLRVQSQRSQLSASFGKRCPQYGHGILSPPLASGRVAGASVYSTLISIIEGHKARGIRQANLQLAAMQRFDRIDRKRLKGALLLFLGFSTQAFSAGLNPYAYLTVNDSRPAPRDGVRVTYLGTNGYQFEIKDHALLVDPYFSRVNLLSIALGSRIQPDNPRVAEGMRHLAPKRTRSWLPTAISIICSTFQF